jgi:hypothetical protein
MAVDRDSPLCGGWQLSIHMAFCGRDKRLGRTGGRQPDSHDYRLGNHEWG